MKNNKLILYTTLFVTAVFSVTLFYSCKKKDIKYNDTTLIRPCENVVCLNGGACSDGQCICAVGFEGLKCESKWSDKFTAFYNTTNDCDLGAPSFLVSIVPNPDFAYKMRINNMLSVCPGKMIDAVINPEKNSFSIPLQNPCGNYYINGYGNRNNDFINIYINTRDTVTHTGTQCSYVLSKN